MPERTPQPTILVLDGDLGFMFALSQELTRRHIAAFPSRSDKEAQSTIATFRLRPDLLVINCSRPGACAFAETAAKEHADVQIVGIVSERYRCHQCSSRLSAILRDPEDRGEDRIGYCADVIQTLLREQRRHTKRAGADQ